MKSRQEMFLCEESEEEKKMLRKTLDSRGVMDVNHTKSRVCSGTNALHSRPGSVWKVENLITYIFNLLSSFSLIMKTCANSHKCIVSTHTEAPHTHGWASGEHKKNTDSIHEIGGREVNIFLICQYVYILALLFCANLFSVVLRTFLFGWFENGPTKEKSWQLWRLHRVKFNPIGLKSRARLRDMKVTQNYKWKFLLMKIRMS